MKEKCFLSFMSFQGPFNSWIPPFSGILQQQAQAQIPGLSQFSLSTLDRFAGLFPNQILFPAQGTQVRQLDPSQPQTPPQTQQGPNQVSRASSVLLFWGEIMCVECENAYVSALKKDRSYWARILSHSGFLPSLEVLYFLISNMKNAI